MVSILKRICNYFDSSNLTKDLTFVGIGVTGIFISGVSTAAISNSFNGELTQCYCECNQKMSFRQIEIQCITITLEPEDAIKYNHKVSFPLFHTKMKSPTERNFHT